MMHHMASKQTIPFGDAQSYYEFILAHITNVSPEYYSVSHSQSVTTKDGEMYDITITNDVENADNDVIAECIVNNRLYYVWKDAMWAVAKDESGRPIIVYNRDNTSRLQSQSRPKRQYQIHSNHSPKRLLIYKACDLIN